MPVSRRSSKPKLALFDAFVPYEDSLVRASKAARKFVEDVVASPWSRGYCLSLCGKSGNGKTMLADLVMAALLVDPWGFSGVVPIAASRGSVRRFSVVKFDMRQWQQVEAMAEPDLAVLDDVGADNDEKKITASKVDAALRRRAGKWTLVTANLGLREIAAKVDSRVASWLVRDENKFVEITAGDYALRKV